ncbi:MAG: DNA primase [Verrucomicrobiales bacterium]
MNRYSDETIQKVLNATNIAELIGSYFPLKRAGKDYRANCPFHHEKTPSFYVIPNKQTYYCFGCGAGGTAVRFVMEYENVDFRSALKKLADRAGVLLPEEEAPDPEAERQRRRRGKLLSVLAEAARWYHDQLLKSPDAAMARDYLKSRGFNRETAVDWQLGYAPADLAPLAAWAKEKKFTGRDLVDCGLAAPKDEENPKAGLYPRFRHRLMFPIHNDYGDVIAFSGRILDPASKLAKYVNSPETSVFHKGATLYGLHRAKRPILKAGTAIICEGQMDLIALAAAGFTHAVAPLGTALTRDHARLLKRHTEVATLCYDADAAGLKAADRAFAELAPAGLTVKVAELPPGEDPDSLLRKEGADALRARLDAATPYVDFFFARRKETLVSGDLASRTAVAREAAAVVARFSDPIAREGVLRQAAVRLNLEADLFRREVRRELGRLSQEQSRDGEMSSTPTVAPPPPIEMTPELKAMHMLVQLALTDEKTRILLAGPEGAPAREHATGGLLRASLEAQLDLKDPATINTFLATRPTAEETQLQAILSQPLPKDGVQAARLCLASLAKFAARDKKRQLRAASQMDPTLDIRQILEIQAQLQQQVLDRRGGVQHDATLPASDCDDGPPVEPGPIEETEDPF